MILLLNLAKAVLGISMILGAWFAVQAYKRRASGKSADTDVLEELTHGCGNCERERACGGRGPERCEELTGIGGTSI